MSKYIIHCLTLIFLLFSATGLHSVQADIAIPFEIPNYGCPMAHADRNMSDTSFLPVPKSNVGLVWHSEKKLSEKAGSCGLGFSGNGKIVACTYHGLKDNLVIYDYDGNIIWSSGYLLNFFAFVSAPIVDIHNRVIACDNKNIILVDPFDVDNDNKIIEWKTELPNKGLAFSPIITENGTLVLATKNGPIYLYDSNNGDLITYKYLASSETNDPIIIKIFSKLGNGFFETINTPCVKGNRIYISCQFTTGGVFSYFKRYGRLYAIDINPEKSKDNMIKIAWYYDFGGPNGASPLLIDDTIYFDSDRLTYTLRKNPQARSVVDKGTTYEEKWVTGIPNPIYGSFAKDPREGFWIIDDSDGMLYRRSLKTGEPIDDIDIDKIVDENGKHKPCSVITICENETRPIMVIAACAIIQKEFSSYVLAIDLTDNNSLLWKVKISDGALRKLDFPFGQYPILIKDGESRIFFSTIQGGAWAIGKMK
jgi:hypothetical protein